MQAISNKGSNMDVSAYVPKGSTMNVRAGKGSNMNASESLLNVLKLRNG